MSEEHNCDGSCDDKKKEIPTPNWKNIDTLYEIMDKNIEEAFEKNKLSYMEIEIVFLMLREKIQQQKHELYSMYLNYKTKEECKNGESETKRESPEGLYK